MAKRRKRERARREPPATVDYVDDDGGVLRLRQALSPGSIAKIREVSATGAVSVDDAWARREELLFERLAVSWEIAGMPITEQAMLLGRLRMANSEELAWVRRTLARHVEDHLPELADR
ncbi:hypothetical protein HJD18_04175 [Thermoleophilia bacterium SCSIO 60948]|nr:hypothetical protein HJD18_04175 [Thermoleophilia bacterium SCSIO 60948]